jgi:CRISPR-associated protein Cmr6
VVREALRQTGAIPDSVSLAYEVWAPLGPGGKVPDAERDRWLVQLDELAVAADYRHAFERWRSSFHPPHDRVVEVELRGRLLVGHGNPSPTEVGLTTHRTWSVPLVPGTALKGLLSHYLEATYGPRRRELAPWDQPDDERERALYQGAYWQGRRVVRAPGEMHRVLFGSPDADADGTYRERSLPAGATRGCVTFHDALYVPASADGDRPFAVDVLTVHQKPYYDAPAGREVWPNDHSAPVPVGFLSVGRGARFLLALSGPPLWTARAQRLLLAALAEWGVGGKTSSGYGRLGIPGSAAAVTDAAGSAVRGVYRPGDRITVTRVEDPKGADRMVYKADDGRLGHFADGTTPSTAIGATVDVWVAKRGRGNIYAHPAVAFRAQRWTRRPPAGPQAPAIGAVGRKQAWVHEVVVTSATMPPRTACTGRSEYERARVWRLSGGVPGTSSGCTAPRVANLRRGGKDGGLATIAGVERPAQM